MSSNVIDREPMLSVKPNGDVVRWIVAGDEDAQGARNANWGYAAAVDVRPSTDPFPEVRRC